MVHIIKDMDEFKTFLKAAGCKLAVVEFSAKWCGACKRICPLFHELAQTYHIKAIPTFQMFKQAQKVCFHGNWQIEIDYKTIRVLKRAWDILEGWNNCVYF
uniref:Thioredoxin domain containing 8 n=1 Tax=Equus asinus asinus TaxID=83772 RepID=A0A8C4N0R4_EQUAS